MLLINPYRFGPPPVSDTDAQAYLTAVQAADGQALETAVRNAINAFVVGCKTDGIWTAIKASCILAGARTLSGALVPLVGTAPTNNNFVSGDYNRKTGLVSDGTKYLNSNRNFQADPQNSYNLCVYASTLTTVNSDYAGSYLVPSNGNLLQRANGLHYGYARSSIGVGGNNSSAGFIGVTRSSSTSIELRSGGVTSTATASPSTAPPNLLTPIFARTDVLPLTGSARLAFYSIGESLNLALLDSRVSTLISALATAIP